MTGKRVKNQKNQQPQNVRVENTLTSLLICILYSNLALLTLAGSVMRVLNLPVLCIICSLITVVVFFALLNKYIRIGVISLLILAVVSTVMYGFANGGAEAIISAFSGYFIGINNLFFGTTNVGMGGELSAVVTLSAVFAFFTYFFVEKLLSPVLLFICNMAVFAVKTLTGDDRGEIYFILLMGVTLLSVAWYAYKNGSKKSSGVNSGFLKSLAAGCVMIAISLAISFVIPVFRSNVSQSAENLFSIGVVSKYSITDSADHFENPKELGGPIKLDDSYVFKVTAKNRVRLMGEVKTEYNGKNWVSANRSGYIYNGGESKDALELCLNLKRAGIDITELSALIKPDTVKISTIFVPAHLSTLSFDTPYTAYLGDDGTVAVKDYITYTYDISYVDTDFYNGYTKLEPLLRATYSGLYNDLDNKKYSYNGVMNTVTVGDLQAKADKIKGSCLRLPDNISDRVLELADEITAGMTDDYQKVEAIKTYLRKYKYTLTPDSLPEGAEITDYFLFEGKEGYCSYFATAFAVLCRAEGIPTRYVEGYNSPVDIGEPDENGDYTYSITNQNAHSWVQVYFEGIGWLDYEPTPPFNYSDMGVQVPKDAFAEEKAMDGFDVKPEEETTEPTTAPMNEDNTDDNSSEQETTVSTTEVATNQKADENSKTPFKLNGMLIVIVAVVIVVAAVALASVITKKRRDRRIDNAASNRNVREATGLCYALIERAGKQFGCERDPAQTAEDYITELSEKFGVDGSGIADMIDKGLYGKEQSGVKVNKLIDFYNELYDAGVEQLHPIKQAVMINWLHMG